ncbi:MAG: tetratricopeptide repeat protein [Planctomycetota bacterium]
MNTKFVLILCGVLVLLVGCVVGVWYYNESRSTGHYIRMADQSIAEGNVRKAVSFYGRAVHRQPNDLDLLDRYTELMQQAEVENLTSAQSYLRDYTGAKRQAAERSGYADDRIQEHYATMYELGRRFNAPGYFEQLVEQAGNRLASDPSNAVALKYRGLASLKGLSRDTPLEIRDRTREDLRQAADQRPEDVDVAWALSDWNLREAQRIDRPGDNIGDRPEEADQLREEAIAVATEMLSVDPANPVRQMRYLELMASPGLNPDGVSPHPSAGAIREIAEAVAAGGADAAEQDPIGLGGVLNVLLTLYPEPAEGADPPMTEGMQMVSDLLTAAGERLPDNLSVMFFAAELDRRMSLPDAALTGFDRVIEGADKADFISYLEGTQLVPRAYLAKGELLLGGADENDPAGSTEIADQVDAVADELAARVGDESPMVDILRGKTLLLRGETAKSIAYLDRASARLQEANLQILLLSARARMQSGQPGAAAERYERVLELQPTAHAIRVDYARLLATLDEADRAREQLGLVLKADPDNEPAQTLMAALMLRTDDADMALGRFEQAAEGGGLQELTTLATVYSRLGRNEEANEVATRALAIDPAHLPALQVAVSTAGDMETRRSLVREAADAGLAEDRVAMLMGLIDLADGGGAATRRDVVDMMIANNNDPVQAGLTEARLYIDSDVEADAERGQAALDALIASHADDPAVIEYRFARAIAAEDLELASQLAEQAAATDADLAGGQFYAGLLLDAQGETDRAILTTISALEDRPIYSRGWARLGSLYQQTGQTDSAIEAFERAVEQSPSNIGALVALTQLSALAGQFDRALETARQAARRSPNNRRVQTMAIALEQQHGDIDRAIEQREQWAERDPSDLTNLRQLALGYAKRGEVEAALETLDRSAGDDSSVLQLVQARAAVYQLAGEPQKGLDVLRGYLQARGDRATTEDLTALAQYYIQNNRQDLAVATLNEARKGEDPDTMPASRAVGDLLFNAGRNEPAAAAYAAVLESSPDDAGVRLRLAETYLRLNRLEDARSALDHPSVSDTDTAKLVQALIAREDGDYAGALRLINQLIAVDPERADLYMHRGIILSRQEGRLSTAIDDLERSLSLDPDSTVARLTLSRLLSESGNPSGAIDELVRLVARTPDFRPGYAALSEALVASGRFSDAEVALGDAARRFPDDPTWPRRMGQLALSRGSVDDAVDAYQQAATLSGNGVDSARLADLLLRANRPAEALSGIESLDPALAAVPAIRVLRGAALNRLGRDDEARVDFEQSIIGSSTHAGLSSVAGRIANELTVAEAVSMVDVAANADRQAISQVAAAGLLINDDAAASVDRLRTVEAMVADDPALAQAWRRTMAIAAYSLDDYPAAAAMYERVLEDNPNDPSALNNYAFMLVSYLDEPARGLELAQRAATLLPQNGRVLDTLGLAELKAGRAEEAILTLQRSRQLEPLGINALHLGMAYLEVGRRSDARANFEEAVRLAESEQDADTFNQARELLASLTDPSVTVESP